jgi:cytochrome c peroxidase
MNATRLMLHRGAYKTPTVRNITLTAPYMHHGIYKTLEEVIWFYNKGGGKGLKLDVPNQTLPEDELKLSKQEQLDLIAFMKSLTDTTGIKGKPERLPAFPNHLPYNNRPIGGVYTLPD